MPEGVGHRLALALSRLTYAVRIVSMDPLSVFIVATVLTLLNGGILGLMHKGFSTEIRPAAADWRIGTLLVAGGVVLLASQHPTTVWLLLPLGNALLLMGLTLYWRSVRRFDRVADTPWLFAPAVLTSLALTWFVVVHPVLWVRVVLACVGWSIALLASARSLFKHRSARREISREVLMGIMLALTGFMIFRAVFFALQMRDVNSILATDHMLNVLTPLSVAILPVIGTTTFLVMCSERLRAELAVRAVELDATNAALLAAIRSREDAERIARHDLKTPLASIAATPELLRAGRALEPDQEQLLNLIEGAARRALSMVNLSLDLYRMENGSFHFEPEAVDLTALVRVVMEDLGQHAQSKRVTMRLACGDEPAVVAANAVLCYSCIANVLKNAVEAASDGSCVELDLQPGERVLLRIHNDTAVPLALRDHFFEKYATHGKSGGSGLGTYSSHLMAKMQGGALTMQTSDSSGTTVTLELPCSRAQNATEPGLDRTISQRAGSGDGESSKMGDQVFAHVLVVDDDSYNCKVLCSQLALYPVRVETAFNGRSAIERALAYRPDLVFMDIEMPVMGGVQAVQHIRQLQKARRQEPSVIIAFTSDDEAQSQARYLASGFDTCLGKPTSQATLAPLLRGLPRPPSPPRQAQPPVKVQAHLLADMPEFLASRLQLMDELEQACVEHDRARLRSVAHRLTGSLAMFGFLWAADVCQQLEHGATGIDLAMAQRLARDLIEHLCSVPVVQEDANAMSAP